MIIVHGGCLKYLGHTDSLCDDGDTIAMKRTVRYRVTGANLSY